MQRPGYWIRIVYALCLAGATVNHVRAVLAHGWLPEHLPRATALFWSSLTIFDPLAVVLLFLRPRLGIALTALIIVSDVAHNLWFVARYPVRQTFLEDVVSSAFLISQLAFLLFVAVTVPLAMRNVGKADSRR